MAVSGHKESIEPATFKERRTKGRVVAFSADIVAEHVPSPAHALQQMLTERATDGFIADPAARRRALARFVGLTLLLWGGSATMFTTLMLMAR